MSRCSVVIIVFFLQTHVGYSPHWPECLTWHVRRPRHPIRFCRASLRGCLWLAGVSGCSFHRFVISVRASRLPLASCLLSVRQSIIVDSLHTSMSVFAHLHHRFAICPFCIYTLSFTTRFSCSFRFTLTALKVVLRTHEKCLIILTCPFCCVPHLSLSLPLSLAHIGNTSVGAGFMYKCDGCL